MNTQKESVLLFFGLVFALSIPIWVVGGFKQIELLPGLPISSLAAFTPALAALIIKYRDDRLVGVFQLLGRSFDFRQVPEKIWYLAFIFINPAVAILAYGVLRASGKALPSPSLTIGTIPLFLVFFIAALGEEIGWTGYVTGPLLRRWGVLSAGIWLGLVWMVWHFIPLVQAQRSADWIAWWSLGTIALRMIMVWLYAYAGRSVFAAALFHAMINLCWQLFPVNGSYYDPRLFSLITLGFAVVLLAGRRIDGRQKSG